MTPKPSKPRTPRSSQRPPDEGGATTVIGFARNGAPGRTVRFGTVTVFAPQPVPAEIRRNVELSTRALERLKDKLVHPGVRLPRKKDVPLYSADEDTPGTFIRLLNGKRDRGVLEDGKFKPV